MTATATAPPMRAGSHDEQGCCSGPRMGVIRVRMANRVRAVVFGCFVGAWGALISGCTMTGSEGMRFVPSKPVRVTGALAPARVDLVNIPQRTAGVVVDLAVEELGVRRARVWLPPSQPPGALIIALHGAVVHNPVNGKLIDAAAQTEHMLDCLGIEALNGLNPLIILPWSKDGQWWNPSDTRYVLGIVRAAEQRWPEVKRLRVVTGYSNGGIGAWYFARLYPAYFDAALPVASNAQIIGPSELPIFAIHGTADEVFPVGPVRAAMRDLADSGYSVVLAEVPGAKHVDECGSYAPAMRAAGKWLQEQKAATPN